MKNISAMLEMEIEQVLLNACL